MRLEVSAGKAKPSSQAGTGKVSRHFLNMDRHGLRPRDDQESRHCESSAAIHAPKIMCWRSRFVLMEKMRANL